MKVQLFTDYACPFCMIQKEILKKFPEVEVEYMYMEIHPEVPEDGGRAEEGSRHLSDGVFAEAESGRDACRGGSACRTPGPAGAGA